MPQNQTRMTTDPHLLNIGVLNEVSSQATSPKSVTSGSQIQGWHQVQQNQLEDTVSSFKRNAVELGLTSHLHEPSQEENFTSRSYASPREDGQKMHVVIHHRVSELNRVIEQQRQYRIKIVTKREEEEKQRTALDTLLATLDKQDDANRDLKKLEQELKLHLEKTLTRSDLNLQRDQKLDADIVKFIKHVRNCMEWDAKKLDDKETETMFLMLNQQHDLIIEGLRGVIKDLKIGDEKDFLFKKKKKPNQAKEKIENLKKAIQ